MEQEDSPERGFAILRDLAGRQTNRSRIQAVAHGGECHSAADGEGAAERCSTCPPAFFADRFFCRRKGGKHSPGSIPKQPHKDHQLSATDARPFASGWRGL